MYLHLGGDIIVKKSEVICFINMESIKTSSLTQDFLKGIYEKKGIEGFSSDTKTVILTESKNYASPISSLTLTKRAASLL